jgi:hypothetical protein
LESKFVRSPKGSHRLAVTYTYSVKGQYYTGTRFGYSGGSSWEALRAAYAAGRDVTCYVNDNDPAEAVLRRDPGGWHWSLPGVFLLLSMASGYVTKRSLAQQHRADSATLYSLELSDREGREKREAA